MTTPVLVASQDRLSLGGSTVRPCGEVRLPQSEQSVPSSHENGKMEPSPPSWHTPFNENSHVSKHKSSVVSRMSGTSVGMSFNGGGDGGGSSASFFFLEHATSS